MNHRESYIGTAMLVWLVTSIFCFITYDYDPDVEVVSIKSFFFVVGGVFVISSIIGYACTLVFGWYIAAAVNRNGLEAGPVMRIRATGKIIKYVEAVIVFFLTILCFRAFFDIL